MDKSKIIKIVIVVVVGIFAIIYYFATNQESTNYDTILTNNIIQENKTKEQDTKEKKTQIKVYIVGEINIPGVVELEEGSRIEDAIEKAGGTKPEADLKNINLAYEVSDGEKIYIPNIAEYGTENETIRYS